MDDIDIDKFNSQLESLDKINNKLYILSHNARVSRDEMKAIAEDKNIRPAMESHFNSYPLNSYTSLPTHVNLIPTQESLVIAAIKVTRDLIKEGVGAVDRTFKGVDAELSIINKNTIKGIKRPNYSAINAMVSRLEAIGNLDPSEIDAKYNKFIQDEYKLLDIYFTPSRCNVYLNIIGEYLSFIISLEKYLNEFSRFVTNESKIEYLRLIKDKRSVISNKLLLDTFDINQVEISGIIGDLILSLSKIKDTRIPKAPNINDIISDYYTDEFFTTYNNRIFAISVALPRLIKALSRVYDKLQIDIKNILLDRNSDMLIELSKQLLDISFTVRNGAIMIFTVNNIINKQSLLIDRYFKDKLMRYKNRVQDSNDKDQIHLLMSAIKAIKV